MAASFVDILGHEEKTIGLSIIEDVEMDMHDTNEEGTGAKFIVYNPISKCSINKLLEYNFIRALTLPTEVWFDKLGDGNGYLH